MQGHLSLDLFGIVHGTADGAFAIGALSVIAIVALAVRGLRKSKVR